MDEESEELDNGLKTGGSSEYVCTECLKTFNNKRYYERHLSDVHHVRKIYNCELCTCKFYNFRNFRRHYSNHRIKNEWECSLCKASFNRKENLERHLCSVHSIYKIECELCGKGFAFRYDAMEHLRVHHKEINVSGFNSFTDDKNQVVNTDYQCLECEKKFLTQQELTAHKKTNHTALTLSKPSLRHPSMRKKVIRLISEMNKKKSIVSQLAKKICDKNNPNSKLNTNVVCKVCKKSFSSKWHLNRHLNVHFGTNVQSIKKISLPSNGNIQKLSEKLENGDKNIKELMETSICYVCDKTFRTSYHLKRHMTVHFGKKCRVSNVKPDIVESETSTSIKDKICPDCGMAFNRNYNLNRHIVRTHKRSLKSPFKPSNPSPKKMFNNNSTSDSKKIISSLSPVIKIPKTVTVTTKSADQVIKIPKALTITTRSSDPVKALTSTPKPKANSLKSITITLKPTVSTPKPLVNVPKSLTSTPKPLVNIPKSISSTPTPLANVPKSITITPTPLANVTKSISSTPTPLVNVTKSVTSTPTPLANITKSITITPTPLVNVTESITSAPTPLVNIPKSKTSAPKPLVNIPKSITSATKPLVNIPKSITSAPKPLVNITKSITIAPKPLVNIPKSSTITPKPLVNVPKTTTITPKPLVNVPKSTTNTAKPLVTVPKSVTSAPKPSVNISKPLINASKNLSSSADKISNRISPQKYPTTVENIVITPPILPKSFEIRKPAYLITKTQEVKVINIVTEAKKTTPKLDPNKTELVSAKLPEISFYKLPSSTKNSNTVSADIKSKPFKCEFCDTRYSRKQDMEHHIESKHFNKCEYCSETFRDKEFLQNHLRKEHYDKLFECQLCQKIFLAEYHLEQHVKYVHDRLQHNDTDDVKASKYQCPKCFKFLSSTSVLRRHRKNVHKEVFESPIS